MKIEEMQVNDSVTKYYIHIWNEDAKMWVPYSYKGYTSIYEDTMRKVIDGMNTQKYKLFQSVTKRIR